MNVVKSLANINSNITVLLQKIDFLTHPISKCHAISVKTIVNSRTAQTITSNI